MHFAKNQELAPIPQIAIAEDRDSIAVAKAALSVSEQLNLSPDDRPLVGVILGSGLGTAADRLLSAGGKSLAYASIPGMPQPHVAGHQGRLICGRIHGMLTVMLQGRIHCYEGHSLPSVQFGTQLLHALGVKTLIVTNAAGGIRSTFMPGDLMVITSHVRPLAASWLHWRCMVDSKVPITVCGDFNSRYSVVQANQQLLWNDQLRSRIRHIKSPLKVHEGVYAMMTGPNYETPAEIRAMQRLGVDAVGMSTVPEALLAASLGIRVLGVSCITNLAAGLSLSRLSHADVTTTAAAIETPFAEWLSDTIAEIGNEHR